MIGYAQYDGDLVPLISWVLEKTTEADTATQRTDPPPREFMEFVFELMPKAVRWHQWAANNTPDTPKAGDWLTGFPHIHAWPADVVTLICYLTACEGGALEIADNKAMRRAKSVEPSPGSCVLLSPDVWHGVRPISAGERLAVIVTGFPQSSER